MSVGRSAREENRGVERPSAPREQRVEGLCLHDVAREAVHDETGRQPAQLAFDHRDDERVGNELPSRHIAFRLTAELRLLGAVAAQQVSGRNLFEAESLVKDAGLRPFAGAGRPKKDDAHDLLLRSYRLMNPR